MIPIPSGCGAALEGVVLSIFTDLISPLFKLLLVRRYQPRGNHIRLGGA